MMPTFWHSKSSRLALGAYDLSVVVNDVASNAAVTTAEVTCLTDGDKVFLSGHADRKVSIKGVADGSTGTANVDRTAIQAVLGSSSFQALSYCPSGYTIGQNADLFSGFPTQYDLSSPVEDAVKFTGSFSPGSTANADQIAAKDRNGLVLLYSTAMVKSTNAGAAQDNGAATAAGFVAHVHEFGPFTGAHAATFQVQHSSNGSAWSDLTTFTALTASTWRRASSTSAAVKRYVRGSCTANTSTAFLKPLITFARR